VDDAYLGPVPEEWPEWQLAWQETPAARLEQQYIRVDEARLNLEPEGQVLIHREHHRSTLLLPTEPKPEAWVHPHLSSTAVVVAWWVGRRSFHAGAFVVDGGAWGILAEREDGKSSMLAWLTSRGFTVLSDDILVIDGLEAMAGPRCIDLRHSASRYFEMGSYIGHIGTRERWRVDLLPTAARVPLRGWVVPVWAQHVNFGQTGAAQRLPLLLTHRGLRVPDLGHDHWLDLLALPMVTFERPKDWSAVDRVMERLLGYLGTLGPSRQGP